jgi:uncharacterized phage-associated protein
MYVVDKLPLNFFWIGYIKKIFPNAKIIHIKRSPIATCFSIYKNLFTEGEFAVMSEVVERFRNTSTSDIIEISHQEKAWIENKEDKNVIDYFYAFDLN